MRPCFVDIQAAANRLAGIASHTPLLSFPILDEHAGGRVFLKAEIFQRTGSFKFRGAYNRLAAIPINERDKGVVACSSGNHAQGVAMAAKMLGMTATIVMPQDAPAIKLERTRELGAQIILYERDTQNREAIAASFSQETGATYVSPYDDPLIIAGQGTAGLEIMEDLQKQGMTPDHVLVCASGGGLAAGIALAVKHISPGTQLYIVEPQNFDDHARSFISGKRERNSALSGSICDALLAPCPGEITFPITKELINQGLTVTDDEVKSVIAFALRELKLVIEPGGAVALAALLHHKVETKGKTTIATLSGGNIDPRVMTSILEHHPAKWIPIGG